jgi:hypothetical protein
MTLKFEKNPGIQVFSQKIGIFGILDIFVARRI